VLVGIVWVIVPFMLWLDIVGDRLTDSYVLSKAKDVPSCTRAIAARKDRGWFRESITDIALTDRMRDGMVIFEVVGEES
jgi:hypothetical protein